MGTSERLRDNLDFKQAKAWDRLKNSTADPSHF